jgi:hypothetical protein
MCSLSIDFLKTHRSVTNDRPIVAVILAQLSELSETKKKFFFFKKIISFYHFNVVNKSFLSFSRRKKIIFIIFTTILIQRNPFYHFYDDFNTFFHFVAESSPPPRERSDGARARSTACVLFAASHTHHGNENNVVWYLVLGSCVLRYWCPGVYTSFKGMTTATSGVSLISHRNSLTKISKRCILNDQAL